MMERKAVVKHVRGITRQRPAPAFYYYVSLTQKITELATIASFADSIFGMIKGLFSSPQEQ